VVRQYGWLLLHKVDPSARVRLEVMGRAPERAGCDLSVQLSGFVWNWRRVGLEGHFPSTRHRDTGSAGPGGVGDADVAETGPALVPVRGEAAGRASLHGGAGADLVLDHTRVLQDEDRPRRCWTGVGSSDSDTCGPDVCPRGRRQHDILFRTRESMDPASRTVGACPWRV
jgi:hypothetical protein